MRKRELISISTPFRHVLFSTSTLLTMFSDSRITQSELIEEKDAQGNSFFDGRFVLMIQVAEEAPALENVFVQLAEQFREDMEHRSKMLGTLLEPLIILVLGAIVGFILLAMYSPIFQMGAG